MTLNDAQDLLSLLLHKGNFVAALTLPSLGSRAILVARVDLSTGGISISSGSTKNSDARKLTHFTTTVQSADTLSKKLGKQSLPTHGSRWHRQAAWDGCVQIVAIQ